MGLATGQQGLEKREGREKEPRLHWTLRAKQRPGPEWEWGLDLAPDSQLGGWTRE
jgi:hypothetical protein